MMKSTQRLNTEHTSKRMILEVKVKAGAKVNEIKETFPRHFEVKVKNAPEHGKANLKVAKLLSEHLHIERSRISLKRGASSKTKWFEVS